MLCSMAVVGCGEEREGAGLVIGIERALWIKYYFLHTLTLEKFDVHVKNTKYPHLHNSLIKLFKKMVQTPFN